MKNIKSKRKPRYVLQYGSDEKPDFDIAYHGIDYYCALTDLAAKLRSERKYGKHTNIASTLEREFYKILEENDVELG